LSGRRLVDDIGWTPPGDDAVRGDVAFSDEIRNDVAVIIPGAELTLAGSADLDAVVKAFGEQWYFAERLTEPSASEDDVFVARRGEDLLGTVTIGPIGKDEVELHASFPLASSRLLTHLEVLEPLRNQGIGSWIMRGMESKIARDGFQWIVLGVGLDNEDAARLYRRLGYRLWRKQPLATTKVNYRDDGSSWQTPDECFIFAKRLVRLPDSLPVAAGFVGGISLQQ
jgi:ribosomal protein S18 acetylase RimI-like enzyme